MSGSQMSSLSEEYDFVTYTDASGDDGVDFSKSGTSKVYAVACFTCHVADIAFNTAILNKIKAALCCRPGHEIKAPTVCKHKDFQKVLGLLQQLKGTVNGIVVLKEKLATYGKGTDDVIYWPSKKNGKNFTAFCHASSIVVMPRKLSGSRFLAVIDNMKIQEMRTTDRFKDVIGSQLNLNTKYVDSKAKGHELVQIIDIIVGILRYGFEEHVNEKKYSSRCATCNKRQKLCRNKPTSITTPKAINIVSLWPICLKREEIPLSIVPPLALYPPFYNRFEFINCIAESRHSLISSDR